MISEAAALTEQIAELLAEHVIDSDPTTPYQCACGVLLEFDHNRDSHRTHVAEVLAARLADSRPAVTETAIEAAAERLYQFEEWSIDSNGDYYENQTTWDAIGDSAQDVYRRMARAALSAALPHMGDGQDGA